MYKFNLVCDNEDFYNITPQVKQAVKESGVTDGIAVIFCPHTTAGITINENCDKYVSEDVLLGVKIAFPDNKCFKHDEGNSTGHIKSSLFGASETVIISEGKLVLGVWQDIYFAEFDPPRNRNFFVKIIKD